MNRVSMFRMPVYEFYNPEHNAFKQQWVDYIVADNYIKDAGVQFTNPNLHKTELFTPLANFLGQSMAGVFLDINMPIDFGFTSMFGAYQIDQGEHPSHTHANSMFSGVYYVHADHAEDTGTVFENVLADYNPFHLMRSNPPSDGKKSRSMSSTIFSPRHHTSFEEGKVVIFPSFLRHHTKTYTGTGRVVVSFNVMPIGQSDLSPLSRYFYQPFHDVAMHGDDTKKYR